MNTTTPALVRIRAMAIAGKHLHACFASQDKRAEGWKQYHTAARAARRLGWTLAALGVQL